ncbi:uncharacterized protein LOC115321895 [Ixodes scapularis]|uniref:uncharacterized protein LOC115321895 n=1 Tax=Ixodes scapularis TaxID=6945 RepID=UPI001A9F20D8|nr:uncharacterized protein LOC115321895 [Ixodes scapularis]
MEKRSAWSLACSVLLGVLCTVGFFYQANSVMQTYLDHPYQSVMTADKRQGLVFPSVTICTGSWINKNSSGCRENPRLCTKYQQEMVFGVFRAQYEPALRWKISHAPHELFECRMRSTTPTCGSFDCRKHIRITYLRLPIQLCYTLDSTRYGAPETELGKCDTPWLYELEAKMTVDPAQTLRLMHTVPFPVFVQPPGHCVPERVAPVALELNQIYHIAVKQANLAHGVSLA